MKKPYEKPVAIFYSFDIGEIQCSDENTEFYKQFVMNLDNSKRQMNWQKE